MDILQLRTLIHVAELGSLSKASDRLHIAQPALSRRIRMLEQELGITLFDRHGRGMVITREGQQVLQHATRILEEMQSIRQIAGERNTSLAGPVSLGLMPSMSKLTAPLTKRVGEEYPEILLRFSSGYSGHLLDWLQQGSLDIGLIVDPPDLETLVVSRLFDEPMFLMGALGKNYAMDTPISFRDLVDYPLILTSKTHSMRKTISMCEGKAGISITPVAEADSFETMMSLVESGTGSVIMSMPMIDTYAKRDQVSVAPIIDPTPYRTMAIVHSSDRPLSAAARYVQKIIADLLVSMIETGEILGEIRQAG